MIRDIVFDYSDDPELRECLRPDQLERLLDIAACGTEAAGLHVEVCNACGTQRLVPNTCGNRCCPHCQGRERAAWVAARMEELLPVKYFHVVMTLPPELRPLAKAFPRPVLGALMQAASDVIDHLCRDPRFLGAVPAQMAILHTWSRSLGWHPHVHIMVTAGGWDAERGVWVDARTYGRQRRSFLLPADVVRCAFQRRLWTRLMKLQRSGAFADGPPWACVASSSAFEDFLTPIMAQRWVLRIEPPFAGPHRLVAYLGRYVNRTAVSPHRVHYDPVAGTATLTWNSNAEPNLKQVTTMPAVAFLKLFAQHILPPRFQRIRFRGIWGTAQRKKKLPLIQQALAYRTPVAGHPPAPPKPPNGDPCPHCGIGTFHRRPGPNPRPPRAERRRRLQILKVSRRTNPNLTGAPTAA